MPCVNKTPIRKAFAFVSNSASAAGIPVKPPSDLRGADLLEFATVRKELTRRLRIAHAHPPRG